jgi:hypothetical protein
MGMGRLDCSRRLLLGMGMGWLDCSMHFLGGGRNFQTGDSRWHPAHLPHSRRDTHQTCPGAGSQHAAVGMMGAASCCRPRYRGTGSLSGSAVLTGAASCCRLRYRGTVSLSGSAGPTRTEQHLQAGRWILQIQYLLGAPKSACCWHKDSR